MILIKKGHEPASLTAYRKQQGAYYDGFTDKDDIRQSLLEEQGYLCAYCMRRIGIDDMKIEHRIPQSADPTEQLDYRNMLGVCNGGEGMDKKSTTCDTHKGDAKITINPQYQSHIDTITYSSATGEIHSSDKAFDTDLCDTLNLNCREQYLPQNRRAALVATIRFLKKKQSTGDWSKAFLAKVRDMYTGTDADGNKREYAGIILWYLDKKIDH